MCSHPFSLDLDLRLRIQENMSPAFDIRNWSHFHPFRSLYYPWFLSTCLCFYLCVSLSFIHSPFIAISVSHFILSQTLILIFCAIILILV